MGFPAQHFFQRETLLAAIALARETARCTLFNQCWQVIKHHFLACIIPIHHWTTRPLTVPLLFPPFSQDAPQRGIRCVCSNLISYGSDRIFCNKYPRCHCPSSLHSLSFSSRVTNILVSLAKNKLRVLEFSLSRMKKHGAVASMLSSQTSQLQ